MQLTDQQINDYQRDGYLLLRQVLDADQLSTLQTVTQNFITQSRDITENNDVYDLADNHCTAQPSLNRIKKPHIQHQAYHEVMHSDNILPCLKQLLGNNIRLHNSKLNAKASQGGAAVQWHQDWAYYPHTNDDLLAIAIMLSDISEEDGPLQVIPGSHRRDALPHDNDGIFCGAIDVTHPDSELDRAVTLTGKAGDMSIHHVRTLHGSAPNRSEQPRLLLLYEFGATDAWPIGGNQSVFTGLDQQAFWQLMQENLICGEQSLQPRLADVPIRMPLPPAPDSSSLFRIQQSGGAVDGFQ